MKATKTTTPCFAIQWGQDGLFCLLEKGIPSGRVFKFRDMSSRDKWLLEGKQCGSYYDRQPATKQDWDLQVGSMRGIINKARFGRDTTNSTKALITLAKNTINNPNGEPA